MRLMVSSLPADFDKYDLQRLFSQFAWVEYAKIYMDPITGRSRRKGVVDIADDAKALKAMETLQGKVLGENPINIKELKDKRM